LEKKAKKRPTLLYKTTHQSLYLVDLGLPGIFTTSISALARKAINTHLEKDLATLMSAISATLNQQPAHLIFRDLLELTKEGTCPEVALAPLALSSEGFTAPIFNHYQEIVSFASNNKDLDHKHLTQILLAVIKTIASTKEKDKINDAYRHLFFKARFKPCLFEVLMKNIDINTLIYESSVECNSALSGGKVGAISKCKHDITTFGLLLKGLTESRFSLLSNHINADSALLISIELLRNIYVMKSSARSAERIVQIVGLFPDITTRFSSLAHQLFDFKQYANPQGSISRFPTTTLGTIKNIEHFINLHNASIMDFIRILNKQNKTNINTAQIVFKNLGISPLDLLNHPKINKNGLKNLMSLISS